MPMSPYELIALDLDGTLLTSDKKILPETEADIALAAAEGKSIVFCTGRCIPELTEYLLPSIRYGILSSGAAIYDFHQNKPLLLKGISPDYAAKIVEAGILSDALVVFHTLDQVVIGRDRLPRLEEYSIGPFVSFLREHAHHAEELVTTANGEIPVTKINLYFHNESLRESAYARLRDLPLPVVFAGGPALEFSPPEVTKASGLRFLAAHLGIPMAQTIAAGDSANDLAVLKEAGLSVVVENGEPCAKALADAIVPDNDHNGVGFAIRHYLLSPTRSTTISKGGTAP